MSPEVERLHDLARTFGRYRPMAYMFVLECLGVTIDAARRKGQEGHITGQELLAGIEDFARGQFGYLGAAVFREWGLKTTRCFGEIVFQLADAGFLSRQESDSIDDFNEGASFETTFETDPIPKRYRL
ncbi:MAG TPA: hypothetical protein PKA37_00425 [Planctomycetota bacterium]|jgi:uncharacterized repeat protein (TIGR04138 family)|nr:hypothetical protein [Planctomycetota bacterium]